MKSSKKNAYIMIILTCIIWGLSFLSIKVSLEEVPPLTLALLRFVIATAILFVILKIKEPQSRLKREDLFKSFLSGLFGITLYFYFENNGIKLISASSASIIVASVPVFTILVEAFLDRSLLSVKKIIGAGISMTGVYFVTGGDLKELISQGSYAGYLFMMGSVAVWIIYSFITKPLSSKYSQLSVVAYQSLFGMLTLLPVSLLEYKEWRMISAGTALNVLFLAVFCSALGYLMYVSAMDVLGVGVTSLFINLIPVITVVASYVLLGETITFVQAAGGVMVIFSVYFVSIKIRKSLFPSYLKKMIR